MSTLTLTAPLARPRRSTAVAPPRPAGAALAGAGRRSGPPRVRAAAVARTSGRHLGLAPEVTSFRALTGAQPRVRRLRPAAPAVGAAVRCGTPALRLTRRGRLAILASALAVTAVTTVATGSVNLAGAAPSPAPVRLVVVEGGDTLWSIAADVAPGVDRRDTVAEIVELNALGGSGVRAGQQIAVPTGG